MDNYLSMQTSYANSVSNLTKYDSTLSRDYKNATEEDLMAACKEFESYFVEQMFKAMHKMVPESEMTSSSTKTLKNYYEEQLISKYAKESTNQGEGLGIAKMLYEQMKRNYDIEGTSIKENNDVTGSI